MFVKKKFAIPVNSFEGVHHKKCPIAYPTKAPITEPIVQLAANLNAFVCAPRTSAIKSASGGIGKKDDSAKARRKRATGPYLVLAQ
jgi:hypothetical protein